MVQCDPEKKLKDKFVAANQKLEEIQKGLSDYLEMKRLYFPRFFFLSNDELLEILSQTKEPRAVQPHLNKAFEGIAKVKFEKDLKITEMISAQGEEVKLNYFVDPESGPNKGNVEKWLLELEKVQWESIRTQTEKSLAEYPKISRTDWTLRWPAQVRVVLLTGSLPACQQACLSALDSLTGTSSWTTIMAWHAGDLGCEPSLLDSGRHAKCPSGGVPGPPDLCG